MSSNESLEFKSEITKKSKGTIYGIGVVLGIIGSTSLLTSMWISLNHHWTVGILFVFIGGVFLLLTAGVFRNKQERYTAIQKILDEGLYDYTHLPDHDYEKEQVISYEQIEAVYLGRGTQTFYQSSFNQVIAYPVIVFEWQQDNERHYRSMTITIPQLKLALSKVPEGIPIKSVEYNLTYVPRSFLGKVIHTSETKDVSFDDSFSFPLKLGSVVHEDVPSWEPPEKRRKKKKLMTVYRKVGTSLLAACLGGIFLISLFWAPNWPIEDEMFATDVTLGIDLVIIMVLAGFFYLLEPLRIWKNILLVLKHGVMVLAAFISGGVIANWIFDTKPEFIDALVVEALAAAFFGMISFLIAKFIYGIIMAVYLLLHYAGATPKQVRNTFEKQA